MRHEAGVEGQGVMVSRERSSPHLTRRVLLGDQQTGVIQDHEGNQQTTQRI